MKVGGKPINGLNEDVLVLPRGDGDIVFRGRAIADPDKFTKMVTPPTPPRILKKNEMVTDFEDSGYLDSLMAYQIARTGFTVIETLYEVEWDTVNEEDPQTFANWVNDLEGVFSAAEQQQILNFVTRVNSLDQGKITAARDAFQIGRAHV
jgi:hypothetical protein